MFIRIQKQKLYFVWWRTWNAKELYLNHCEKQQYLWSLITKQILHSPVNSPFCSHITQHSPFRTADLEMTKNHDNSQLSLVRVYGSNKQRILYLLHRWEFSNLAIILKWMRILKSHEISAARYLVLTLHWFHSSSVCTEYVCGLRQEYEPRSIVSPPYLLQ